MTRLIFLSLLLSMPEDLPVELWGALEVSVPLTAGSGGEAAPVALPQKGAPPAQRVPSGHPQIKEDASDESLFPMQWGARALLHRGYNVPC